MSAQKDTIQLVRESAEKKLLFLPHTIQQMSRPDRMISTSEVHRKFIESSITVNLLRIIQKTLEGIVV